MSLGVGSPGFFPWPLPSPFSFWLETTWGAAPLSSTPCPTVHHSSGARGILECGRLKHNRAAKLVQSIGGSASAGWQMAHFVLYDIALSVVVGWGGGDGRGCRISPWWVLGECGLSDTWRRMLCFANVNLWKCNQWICHAVPAVGIGTRCPELLQVRCLPRCLHSSSQQCYSAPTSVPGQQSTSSHHSLLRGDVGLPVGQDLGGSEMSSCLPKSHSSWRPEQIAQVWAIRAPCPPYCSPSASVCQKSPLWGGWDFSSLFFFEAHLELKSDWFTYPCKVKLLLLEIQQAPRCGGGCHSSGDRKY